MLTAMTTRHLSLRVTAYGTEEWCLEVLETVCEPARPARCVVLSAAWMGPAQLRTRSREYLDRFIELELQRVEKDGRER